VAKRVGHVEYFLRNPASITDCGFLTVSGFK